MYAEAVVLAETVCIFYWIGVLGVCSSFDFSRDGVHFLCGALDACRSFDFSRDSMHFLLDSSHPA